MREIIHKVIILTTITVLIGSVLFSCGCVINPTDTEQCRECFGPDDFYNEKTGRCETRKRIKDE